MAKFEKNVQELQEAIKCVNQAEIQHTKLEEQKFACQLREQQMEQEMKFEQAKLEQKLKMEKKAQLESTKKHESESSIHTKLPKLVITKFKGVPTDWLRFWNQFV